jgi:lysozyme
MIQRTGINDPNATGVAAPDQVQAQDTFGVSKVGSSYNADILKSLAKFGERMGVRELEKEAKANFIAGQSLRAGAGTLTGKEPAPTRRGFKALDAKLKAQAWLQSQKELVDNELNDSDPEEYAGILADNVKQMFTGDPETDAVLTSSLATYSGELGRYQAEANYKKRTADGISQATGDVRNHLIAIQTAKSSGDVEGEANARASLAAAMSLPTVQNPVLRKQLAGDLAVMGLELGDPSVLNLVRESKLELDVDQERKIAAAESAYNQNQKRKLDIAYQRDTGEFETNVLNAKSLDEFYELAEQYQTKYPNRTTNDYIINQEGIFKRALAQGATKKLFVKEMKDGKIAKSQATPKQQQETFETIKQEYLTDVTLTPQEADKAIRNVWKGNGIVINSVKSELTAGLSVPLKDGVLHPNFPDAFEKASEYYSDAPDLLAKHLGEDQLKLFLDTKAATTYGGMDLGSAVSMLEEHRVSRQELTREERDQFNEDISDAVDNVLGKGFFNFQHGLTTVLTNDAEVRTRLSSLANIALNQGMKDPEQAVEFARTKMLQTHEQLGDALVFNGGTPFYKRMGVPQERVNDAMDYMYEKLTEADPTIDRANTVLLGSQADDKALLVGVKNEYGVITRVIPARMQNVGANFKTDVLEPETVKAESDESVSAEASEQSRELIQTAIETRIYTKETAEQAMGNIIGRNVLESRVNAWRADEADRKLAEEYGTESKEELEDLKFMKNVFTGGITLSPEQIKMLQDGDIEAYKKSIGDNTPMPTQTVPDNTAYIESVEGNKATVYEDTLGFATAGIGHKLTDSEKAKYPKGTEVPKDVRDKWFKEDSAKATKAATKQLNEAGIKSAEAQKIFESVNFQLGTNWTSKFPTTWKLIKEGKYTEAAKEVQMNGSGTGPSKWKTQTPNRVAAFVELLNKL